MPKLKELEGFPKCKEDTEDYNKTWWNLGYNACLSELGELSISKRLTVGEVSEIIYNMIMCQTGVSITKDDSVEIAQSIVEAQG